METHVKGASGESRQPVQCDRLGFAEELLGRQEFEAALRRLAQETGVAERLSARGLERCRNFTAAATARATWGVYEEALAASA